MSEMAFEFLDLTEHRSIRKPRRTGQTMVIDMGCGPQALRDQLRVIGPYVDLAKFAVGSARLYRRDLLIEKIEVYEAAAVRPFLGGQFVEYVMAKHGLDMIPRFMAEARDLGFFAVEISDNCIDLSDDQRRELIKMGLDAGLHVHGEVGSKLDKADIGELVRQAELMLGAGCDVVLFEAAELVDAGVANESSLSAINASVPHESAMIELPGPWIKGVTHNDVYEVMKKVLDVFGPDANIGNVSPSEILELECTRTGLGTSGPNDAVNQIFASQTTRQRVVRSI